MFAVIGTPTYLASIEKWPKIDRESAEKIPQHLKENPFLGKPLGYAFLREKRIRERRVYYLVYEEFELVLLVASSGKKDQQATIDHIKNSLEEFRKAAEQISKQVS